MQSGTVQHRRTHSCIFVTLPRFLEGPDLIPPFSSTPDKINDGEHHDVTPFTGCKTGGKLSLIGFCSGSCCCLRTGVGLSLIHI